MPDPRPILTLAHSPDPDDAFMWWPITGKVAPSASLQNRDRQGVTSLPSSSPPALDTGRFRYQALPADIEQLNRRAAAAADLEITALSARAYADVADRYVITACGGSFGEGYGPKVVARADSALHCEHCLRGESPLIAVPGTRTTAFMVLSLLIGGPFRFVEMPFERIIGAVAAKNADAGLIIHEGQLAFQDAALRQIADLGQWWQARTTLPLPLGVNAIRRDLDALHGPGSVAEVAATLDRSVRYAAAHRDESIEYAGGFAMANLHRQGTPSVEVPRARIERYIDMYVTPVTLDMGDRGRAALRRLYEEGSRAGLCPSVASLDLS